ncbi:MAG: alpha-L-fucosidase [Oscillospiraceae bacterium]|jgi:alpha-L-fucosidase|nr:alpha-L-fucosidase [Oscillospiraceae bacterium]
MNIKQKQLEFLEWELGVFFHFGIRTFYEGHKDWDMQVMLPEKFNPEQLDCEQWIRGIQEAGANYAVFVTKHHDGFANWPSAYTEYSVANTPWKQGKGDVVKEYTDACRKYGLKIGLYYSPAEFGSVKKSAEEYDNYFINQVTELLTNYGTIDYLWFDGCGSENHQYDTNRIIGVIRRLQPEILIFNMWDPDTRWVGNEAGIAHSSNKNVVNNLDFSVKTDMKERLDEDKFLPVECDCRMRLDNWFYSENDEDTVKTLDELLGLYYYSVGRGANLLINIGPDRRGLLPEKDLGSLRALGREVKHRFESPLADTAQFAAAAEGYEAELAAHRLVNHVILQEDISSGGAIEKFKIKVYPYPLGDAVTVFCGDTVGHKAICRFPSIRTQKIVIETKRPLKKIQAFYVK